MTAYDIKLGEVLEVHSRTIYLYDCDVYTR